LELPPGSSSTGYRPWQLQVWFKGYTIPIFSSVIVEHVLPPKNRGTFLLLPNTG
jgi:hypothetical protein